MSCGEDASLIVLGCVVCETRWDHKILVLSTGNSQIFDFAAYNIPAIFDPSGFFYMRINFFPVVDIRINFSCCCYAD